jgi:hypothetical protein
MQTRDAASRHWVALDRVVSRLLRSGSVSHARGRVARRAEVLSELYMRRLVRLSAPGTDNRSDVRRQLLYLQQTHRALSAALAATWSTHDGREDT